MAFNLGSYLWQSFCKLCGFVPHKKRLAAEATRKDSLFFYMLPICLLKCLYLALQPQVSGRLGVCSGFTHDCSYLPLSLILLVCHETEDLPHPIIIHTRMHCLAPHHNGQWYVFCCICWSVLTELSSPSSSCL